MTRKSADQIPMAFSDENKCTQIWVQHNNLISDRGSKYSVTGGEVHGREDVKDFLKKLKKDKKFATATHNTWAARIEREGAIFETKSDDGETGAGQVILHIMRKKKITNCAIVVTRWFGGIKLQNDRYKHVQDATKYIIEESFLAEN